MALVHSQTVRQNVKQANEQTFNIDINYTIFSLWTNDRKKDEIKK